MQNYGYKFSKKNSSVCNLQNTIIHNFSHCHIYDVFVCWGSFAFIIPLFVCINYVFVTIGPKCLYCAGLPKKFLHEYMTKHSDQSLFIHKTISVEA